MTTKKGTISVNTSDILPIIKKWLYSEHDIFLRELISNGSDAITKRKILGQSLNQEIPNGEITIEVDKDQKIIRVSDNGLGMTEEEVQKYIAQVAFSGAKEFVEKMKAQGADRSEEIIGKFGLGFYSAFMVADKVEVETLSFQEGAQPVKWTCEGDTEYTFSDSDKKTVGTTITLHLNQENEKFLEAYQVRSTITKYCSFMPYPIYLEDVAAIKEAAEKKAEQKAENKSENNDNKNEDVIEVAATKEPLNESTPIWKKDPTTLTDEDYLDFYRKHFPMDQDPLFWIHLKVDHPFELLGILYFPKFNPTKPVQDHNIHLYAKQVFVSDNVKDIIPDFLSLLKGHIDSPDIPLNVSRSSLQGDPNVSKISNYIIKKVAESLKKLFNKDRAKYETIWKDIGLFVKYGCISDTKFDELMREFVLLPQHSGKLLTMKEYQEAIPEQHKEKMKEKILYYEAGKADLSLLHLLKNENLQATETDSYIDPHFMQHAEYKKVGDLTIKFVSVDSEIENLLATENADDQDMKIQELFKDILVGKADKKPEGEEGQQDENKELTNPLNSLNGNMDIEIKKFKEAQAPAYFKIDEQMKRFQQMTKSMGQSGMDFPVKKTLVVNPANPLVRNALKLWEKGDKKPLVEKICHHVQDLALISSVGFNNNEEKDKFVRRSQDLIQELSQYIV